MEEQRQFLPAAPIMHNGLLHCARCKISRISQATVTKPGAKVGLLCTSCMRMVCRMLS